MNCICCIDNMIEYICKNEYKFFLSKKNVVGVGFGYKVKNTFVTSKKCIVVFVSSKISLNNICSEDLVPKMYKGIETDVVESGIISLDYKSHNTNFENPFRKRVRPVLGGYSIGMNYKPTALVGTMACLVTDNHDRFLLSCNHVLADINKVPLGTFVLQPSTLDGGKSPRDIIASLSEYVPVSESSTNLVDCAMAKVMNKDNVSPKIALVGTPKGVVTAKYGIKVKKVGESTGLTTGKVIGVKTTLKTSLEGRDYLFKNQVVTSPMTAAGDSGALLLTDNNYALGLLIAGNEKSSMANTMSDVLNSLNVLLVIS